MDPELGRSCEPGELEAGICLACGAMVEGVLVDLYKDMGMCVGAKAVECEHDGYTMDQLMGYIGLFSVSRRHKHQEHILHAIHTLTHN